MRPPTSESLAADLGAVETAAFAVTGCVVILDPVVLSRSGRERMSLTAAKNGLCWKRRKYADLRAENDKYVSSFLFCVSAVLWQDRGPVGVAVGGGC